MSADERPERAASDAVLVGMGDHRGPVGDARARIEPVTPSRRVPLSVIGLLGAWLVLAAGLCYLIATQLPGKSIPLSVAAVILAGLGALLGFAVHTGRRVADGRLRAELANASHTLRSIEAVSDPGLAFLELEELLHTVLGRATDAVGGDVAAVLLTDGEGPTLRVRASAGATRFAPVGSEVEADEGVLGTATSWGRPVVVPDVREDEVGALPEWQQGIASLMAAPLIVHGATLGIVEVASLVQRSFGAADLRLLQVVADRLAAVVERARLDAASTRSRFGAEHANMHLRILARGGTVLGKALEDYDAAMRELADVVVPDFADWFGVHVLEASGVVRRVDTDAGRRAPVGRRFQRAGHPHPKGDELVREAIAQRRAQVLMPTARLDSDGLGAAVHTPETLGEWPDVTSMLVIPVQVRGASMACLSFVTGPDRRGFRPSDLETAKELAERVGVAIERVLSLRATQRAGEMAFHYAERLRRLVDASLVVNAQFGESEVLQLLVEHTQRALDADVSVVSALPSGGPLAEKAWPLARVGDTAHDDDIRSVVLAASRTVTQSGDVARSPNEWTPDDALPTGATSTVSTTTAASSAGDRGWMAAPITDATDEVRRVVVAVGQRGSQFSFEDESVLTLLAKMASVALRNARLYAEVLGNEQRLETLVDSSPLAIAELRATGEAQWWNRAAAELFGWSDHSVPRRIPVRAGSEAVLEELLDSSFGGEPIIGLAVPVVGAGSVPLELSVSASPLGAPGAITGLLVVADDVTERQRMAEQLRQGERLDAMSWMAGALAHDFNNLLTVILGCSEALMRRMPADDDLVPDVAAIQRAGQRAASLTSQLLRIGGQQHLGQPDPVAIDEAIAGMGPMLSGALGENVHLDVSCGAGDTTVLVDRGELERSVLNLAINARDAMPSGGTFTVETTRVPPHPSGAELIELSFADTGTGMDEDTAAHCLEPFFTTKGRARGTGLGLAAVHATVSQAGGDLRVETSPGAGARFTITLPVAEGRSTAARPELPEDPRASSPIAPVAEVADGETVLVVDDEPEVLRLEARELRSAGYDVHEASDASVALDLLDSRGGAVDLLVTDVVMPGMNGFELAWAVRWRYPDVAILLVSGSIGDGTVEVGPLPEGASFLTKPFGPDELSRKVRESLNRSRGTTSAPRQGSKR